MPWLLTHGLRILLMVIISFILYRYISVVIRKMVRMGMVKDAEKDTEAELKRKDTLTRIFSWACRVLILVIATLVVLEEIGVPIGPILAGAGILGLALGFGGQYLIRDLIAGFFIILENQYRIGDIVNLDGTGGLVEDISLRLTTLRDLDGNVHHVPHGEIKRVTNMSKTFSRINLNIRVAYQSDLEQVIQVVNEVGETLANEEQWKDAIIKTPQFLRVDHFTESAIEIKILGETPAHRKWEVTGELRKRIKLAFDKAGIAAPFPRRIIENAYPFNNNIHSDKNS